MLRNTMPSEALSVEMAISSLQIVANGGVKKDNLLIVQ